MAENIAGQSLSAGWSTESVIKFRGGSNEWDRVTDLDELVKILMVWLDVEEDTGFESDQLRELIVNQSEDETDAPWWQIPLNVERLSELVTGDRYLCSEFEVEGTRYQILIDYTDF